MKHLSIFFLALCITLIAQAQQAELVPSLKFGKPSPEELSMTTYAQDTSAVAVVLYKTTDVRYDYVNDDFRVIYDNEVKIKVLKTDGMSYGDVSISYYEPESGSRGKEIITGIDASSYNMEDGKMVREKMKRDLIFKERLNKKYMQVKFSIPNVKVGTVLEYRYKTTSDFYYSIDGWTAQQEIPVLYGQYDITIPEYFKFNLDMRGRDRLEATDKQENLTFNIMSKGQTDQVHCTGRRLTFKADQLPGLKADSYIWCPDDYKAQAAFELKGIAFPGVSYKDFTHSWENIDKMLLDDEDFGGLLKMRNPYREEVAALGIDKLPDVNSKVAALFTFLRTKMNWNEQYRIDGPELKKAIKSGTGSNADMNFVFMSMLREANISCAPVVMSRRSSGVLPLAHPSIQKLNTFIVGIANTDSTYIFMDGSVRTGYINVIPTVLMVDRARMITPKGGKWMDLRYIGKNALRSLVNATLDTEGKITGTRTTAYLGQYASSVRSRFKASKDSTEYISKIEKEEEVKVSDLTFKQLHTFSPQVEEAITFEKQAMVNDNLIYLNPMIFLHVEKSPFTQAERKLPVELPYTEQITLSINIEIPEGYAIEELPKPLSLVTEDGTGKCRYYARIQNNTVSLSYTFSYDQLIFTPEMYPSLKEFWESIVEKNNEMLVLKKL